MVCNTKTKSILLLCLFFTFSANLTIAQNKRIDRLEQFYGQGHFKMVNRKSNKLLKNPMYEGYVLPSYYAAMSTFQLLQNPYWMRRNLVKIDESCRLMELVFKDESWPEIKDNHSKELGDMAIVFELWLKQDNSVVAPENKAQLMNWIENVYKGYKFKNPILEEVDASGLVAEGMSKAERTDLIHYAYEYMGIPYKWGGTDEAGFDCSGFTSHVFQRQGISLPRVASEQYKVSKTIRGKRAFMGDLVFFSEGKEITHVGILVNQPNEKKRMIHSGSTKGISVVDIEGSDYWRGRLVGFGRIIK